jgi:hypothetical protein
MGAIPMGAPGCPEFAFPGMSTAKQRIVLMHFQSRSEYEDDFAVILEKGTTKDNVGRQTENFSFVLERIVFLIVDIDGR